MTILNVAERALMTAATAAILLVPMADLMDGVILKGFPFARVVGLLAVALVSVNACVAVWRQEPMLTRRSSELARRRHP